MGRYGKSEDLAPQPRPLDRSEPRVSPPGIAGGKFRSTTGQNRLKPMETGAGILTF